MKLLRFAALACVLAVAAACLPVTTSVPVGSTAGFKPDMALAGSLWKGHGLTPGQTVYASFFPQDDGTITALLVSPGGKDSGWAQYSLQTATLGSYSYMNAHEVGSDGKLVTGEEAQKGFPLLYRVNGDGALVIYLMDEKKAAAAIRAGKIAGTVEPGSDGDVTITAPAADLDAFMQTPDGRALFDKPMAIFKKER
ncbi:MAG: hypothetical protein ACREHE_10835 [Rhizomicrobium sp.]